MSNKAFVYTELQISLPFAQAPWREINPKIQQQAGFENKTWLAGIGNDSIGGFYTFDSIENAQTFVTGYFPSEAASIGVAHTTRIFDASKFSQASLEMHSPHFDGEHPPEKPKAFVYTEFQVNLPPDQVPWQELSSRLKQQAGLLAKTWLSGLHTNTTGGIYAFDTIENAKRFTIDFIPTIAKELNAAFYTRVFDADITEEASRELHSPYYQSLQTA